MPTSKQLEKLNSYAEDIVIQEKLDGSDSKQVRYLSSDPGREQREISVLVPIAIPGVIAGILGPETLEISTGMTIPGLEIVGLAVAGATIVGTFLFSGMPQSREIKSAFKYNLGYKLSREKTAKLRKIQKALGQEETKVVPASQIFETSEVIDFVAAKGYEVDIVVSKDRIALQWVKPAESGTMWDEALNDMVEVFQLKEPREAGQIDRSFTKMMTLRINQTA